MLRFRDESHIFGRSPKMEPDKTTLLSGELKKPWMGFFKEMGMRSSE